MDPMLKIVISVWIYLCGLFGSLVTAAQLSQVLAAFPASQLESYGSHVPVVARSFSAWLPHSPLVLWLSAAATAIIGIYLWRSRHSLENKLFASAVIAALNLFLAMFFADALLTAYFYLPKVANTA